MFKYEFALERARLLSGLVSLHLSLLSLCLSLLSFGCNQHVVLEFAVLHNDA